MSSFAWTKPGNTFTDPLAPVNYWLFMNHSEHSSMTKTKEIPVQPIFTQTRQPGRHTPPAVSYQPPCITWPPAGCKVLLNERVINLRKAPCVHSRCRITGFLSILPMQAFQGSFFNLPDAVCAGDDRLVPGHAIAIPNIPIV